MFVYNQSVPAQEAGDGVIRKVLAYSENLMLCELRLAKGAVVPAHNHMHEQSTYVVSGSLSATIGEETHELKAGDCILAKGNIPHSVTALEDCVTLDAFTPARADFL